MASTRIDTAMSGHEAINLVKQLWEDHGKLYRIIFLDCEMPVMSGYECSLKINEFVDGLKQLVGLTQNERQSLDSGCAIVAVSGYVGQSHEEKCKKHGMQQILGKPPSDQKIKQILKDKEFM